MSNLKAILFDFEGTLADTNQLITDSFLHVLTPLFLAMSKLDVKAD